VSDDYGLLRAVVFVFLACLEPPMRLVAVFAPHTMLALALATDDLLEWSRPPRLPEPWTDLRVAYRDEHR
jgi:hypothetical protein